MLQTIVKKEKNNNKQTQKWQHIANILKEKKV